MKQEIESLVDGGNASAGPPLGPALGPMGVNIGQVVAEINEKTRDFEGMKVPVKVTVDPSTKEFDIEVGVPPTSALVLKEAGVEKGSGDALTTLVGNVSIDKVVKIASVKQKNVLAASFKAACKEVVGTCVSMGISVEGKPPKQVLREIEAGSYDDRLIPEVR